MGEVFIIDCEKVWFKFVKNNLKDLFLQICDITRFKRTVINSHNVI